MNSCLDEVIRKVSYYEPNSKYEQKSLYIEVLYHFKNTHKYTKIGYLPGIYQVFTQVDTQ